MIDESWSEGLGGLLITSGGIEDQKGSVTELEGQVRDQAELMGIMNSLYELHMTVISVEHRAVN